MASKWEGDTEDFSFTTDISGPPGSRRSTLWRTGLSRGYDRRRLHSALSYVPPVEFEMNLFKSWEVV